MIALLVKVKPGAGRDEIKIEPDGSLTVKIKAKPIEGQANDYLIKYLADAFDLSRSKIILEKGATSRFKRVGVNVSAEEWDVIKLKVKN